MHVGWLVERFDKRNGQAADAKTGEAMKRRVKMFNKRNGPHSYSYFWIGYQTRNANGTPVFIREINISALPRSEIERIDMALKAGDDDLVLKKLVIYEKSLPIGAAWGALRICEDLGIYSELATNLSSVDCAAVMAMVVDRVANTLPMSKRALANAYENSAVARILEAGDIPFEHWYSSLDDLCKWQNAIERGLASRANTSDTIFMYDITSVYFEGEHCPLAKFGYNRDGKKGKLQIVVGMLTNSEGRPLGVRVFEGNTKDDTTVLDQMRRVKEEFNADKFIFVGDRGMVTGSVRAGMDALPGSGVDYITALTRREILALAEDDGHPLQIGLFDLEMAEVEADGVRYVLCRNPLKAVEDKTTRSGLVAKTVGKLENLRKCVAKGQVKSKDVIAKRLYRWLNHWKMEKYLKVHYDDGIFAYELDQELLDEAARLDGCYAITTTVDKAILAKDEVVGHYKRLTWVEQVFRHMKTTDEFVRPVRHWNADRVRGHVFVCMLAYLVIWKARRCLSEFLERDDDTNMCEGGSLREIWEALDKGVTIGTISLDGKSQDQLSPIPNYQKRILLALNASINSNEKRRLRVVG